MKRVNVDIDKLF